MNVGCMIGQVASDSDARSIVVAVSLTKRYGSLEAVRDVSFSIQPRECYGFLGRNGAGKTTTMKMVYCRTARSSGSLHVLGMDAARSPEAIKRRIGVVTQENALDQELSVLENLLVYAAFFNIDAEAARTRARRLLASMSLEGKETARLKELSGGMKRRLVIVRALINEPELLVLDEPTTGLDPQARLMVWEKLNELRASGMTLILTTHNMEEAARLCDRIAIMEEGRIFAEGPPAALVEGFAAPDVLEIVGFVESAAPDRTLDGLVRRRERHGETTYLYNDDNRTLLRRLNELGADIGRHVARHSTLEDVFLNITGRELTE